MPTRTEKIEALEKEIHQLKRLLDQYSLAFSNSRDIPADLMENIQKTYNTIQEVQNRLAELRAETVSANPEQLEKHQDLQFTDVTSLDHKRVAELFKTGKDPYDGSRDDDEVSHNDVDQGSIGDCYFMAALGAVAKANPDAIKHLISGPDSNGNYQVKLYVNKNNLLMFSWRSYEMVTVTPEVLTNSSGKPIYAGSGDGELWPMLIEKAYALLRGKYRYGKEDYPGIVGGSGEEAIEVLTGQEADMHFISRLNDEQLYQKIRTALDDNKAITSATPGEYSDAQQEEMREKGIPLYASHVYYILDINTDEITMRNPHNNSSKFGRTFTMSMDDYRKYFRKISRQR